MSSSDLIRWGGLAAMGGGVLFLLYSLFGFAVGNGEATSPLVLLAILGYVLVGVGLVGFHTLQGGNYGRIGRAGLYTRDRLIQSETYDCNWLDGSDE